LVSCPGYFTTRKISLGTHRRLGKPQCCQSGCGGGSGKFIPLLGIEPWSSDQVLSIVTIGTDLLASTDSDRIYDEFIKTYFPIVEASSPASLVLLLPNLGNVYL
jgi:hypothetical protein